MPEDLNLSNSFSVAAAAIALTLNAILTISMCIGTQRRTKITNYSLLLFLCVFLFSCAHIAENLLEGRPGGDVHLPLQIACFCDYLFADLLAFAGSGFLLTFADPRRERGLLWSLLIAFLALAVVLLILGQCFGWYFTIDESNRYHRGPLYSLSLLCPALMLLQDVYVLLFRSRKLGRVERLVLWSCVMLPITSAAMQLFFRDFISAAILAVALLLHIFLAQRQLQMFHLEQEKNLRLQTEILLSQIQPHFMYNTLAAVADLCDTDAPRAKQSILLFTRYLQRVVLTQNSAQTTPFAEELTQIKRYLELSQLRFEDALRVEYQIGCSEFSLPTMCLQPLVENAVQHGVRRNPGGRGTVSLRTDETADCWLISVSDDGPGFDRRAKPERSHTQVGLKNVEERLRLICGGSLELASAPGKGTCVTLRIPKRSEGQKC